MPRVQLAHRFWDGERMHMPGEELILPEGSVPKSAKMLDAAINPPADDEAEALRARIAELEAQLADFKEPELALEPPEAEPDTLSAAAKAEAPPMQPEDVVDPTPPSALVKPATKPKTAAKKVN